MNYSNNSNNLFSAIYAVDSVAKTCTKIFHLLPSKISNLMKNEKQ